MAGHCIDWSILLHILGQSETIAYYLLSLPGQTLTVLVITGKIWRIAEFRRLQRRQIATSKPDEGTEGGIVKSSFWQIRFNYRILLTPKSPLMTEIRAIFWIGMVSWLLSMGIMPGSSINGIKIYSFPNSGQPLLCAATISRYNRTKGFALKTADFKSMASHGLL